MASPHEKGTIYKEWATAGFVNVEEDESREDNEKCILDAGGNKVDVARQVCHHEDIHNILFEVSSNIQVLIDQESCLT